MSIDYDDLNYGDHVEDHDDPDDHGDHVDAYRDDIFLGDDGPQIVEVESGRPSPKTTSVNPQQNLVIVIVELSDVFFFKEHIVKQTYIPIKKSEFSAFHQFSNNN